jgi:cytochrome c556
MKSASAICVAASAMLASAVCTAHGLQPKPEDVIHYRQSVMTLIGWNFGPMSAMAKGKLAWDAKEFALHADRVAALAPMAPEGFAKGSDKGAETDAKPDIWANPEDFQSKLNDLANESKALSNIAKGGDEAKVKDQFKKLAGACKNCHDKYKAD